MAGYKTTIFNDEPIAFWTFDLDSDILHGNTIIDEIGNQNPLTTNGENYRLENTSLNDLEVVDQHSVIFAENEKYNGDWSNVYFVCPHTSTFSFNDEFSIEFLIKLDAPNLIRQYGEPGYTRDIITPVIKKGSMFELLFIEDYHYHDSIRVRMFGDTFSVKYEENVLHTIWGKDLHIVVKYKAYPTDISEWKQELRLYVNGRNVVSNIRTIYTPPQSVNVADPWYIAGNGGSDPVKDFVTEPMVLDQISIWDYWLTDEQVSNHYRKTRRYDDLIKNDYPAYYWRMDDPPNLDTTIYNSVGGIDGELYEHYTKYENGPDNIIDAHSVLFYSGGSSLFINQTAYWNNYVPFIKTGQDYAVEFWFKSGADNRGVLFSATQEKPKYNGVTVALNSRNFDYKSGMIQFNEGEDYTLHSLEFDDGGVYYDFSDNKWHHIVVTRIGDYLYLYIDGILHNSGEFPVRTTAGKPTQVHLMSDAPGGLSVDGWASEVAIYNYGMQAVQINSRYHFSTRHKIFGYTLLEGQGRSALVRFYNTLTGEFVGEVTSNHDGEYTFYTYSNRQLDILAKLPDNNTTRYRVHGPITPAEYSDPHITP